MGLRQMNIEAINAGDENSIIDGLVSLLPIVRTSLRDKGFAAEIAEDIVQETILKTLEGRIRFGHFDDDISFRSLVMRIAQNLAYDRLRQISRSQIVQEAQERALSSVDSQEQLEQKIDVDNLASAIEGLPKEQARIIELLYFQDMDLSEIASVMDITPERVRALRSMAIRRLREFIMRNKGKLGA
jgi:RNA polymerase sigma factor (sigma-70 family)